MSKETLPQQPNNEEVDLGQLFDAIGKLFERLYNFIVSIFEFIFRIIILGSKAVIDNENRVNNLLIFLFLHRALEWGNLGIPLTS